MPAARHAATSAIVLALRNALAKSDEQAAELSRLQRHVQQLEADAPLAPERATARPGCAEEEAEAEAAEAAAAEEAEEEEEEEEEDLINDLERRALLYLQSPA